MDVRLSPRWWTTLASLVAAAAVFAAGYWAGVTNAAALTEATRAPVTLPDWFLPIWDAYDRNPDITPEFAFASLYSGDIDPPARGAR